MKKWIPVSVAAAMTLSTFAASDVQAAAKYKLKNQKLVHAKTGKTVSGKAVYKNRLYVNGKLAKNTVLYKNTLYVDGKIKSGIVLYKGTFYKKGKKVAATTKFVYKNKLYIGQKLATGYVKAKDAYDETSLFYNGKRFTGFYKSIPYDSGYSLTSSNLNDFTGSLYKPDGSQIVYVINLEEASTTPNIKDMKAVVTNDPTVTTTVAMKNNRIIITLDNTKKTDATYKLSISGINFKKVGNWSFDTTIKSATSKLTKMDGYSDLNNAYWNYKDYTKAQLSKVPKNVMSTLAMYSMDYGMNGPESMGSSADAANYNALIVEINRLFDDLFDQYMEF